MYNAFVAATIHYTTGTHSAPVIPVITHRWPYKYRPFIITLSGWHLYLTELNTKLSGFPPGSGINISVPKTTVIVWRGDNEGKS